MASSLAKLLQEARACRVCEPDLPAGCRPIVSAAPTARLLVIGQAPGRRVHASGVPWDDPSGDRLRDWLGLDAEQFYDASQVAIVPMGFCYPGTGKSGDLPPRPECAPLWHPPIVAALPKVELTLLLSRYAIDHYLPGSSKRTVTERARAWKQTLPLVPMPHPSPRNNRWLKQNPWFEAEVIPELRGRVARLMAKG